MLNLLELQRKQHIHDLEFHQDIAILSVQNRIKHIVLHFTKYLGKMQEKPNDDHNAKIYTDIFICCLCMANTLNIQLGINNDYQITDVKKFEYLYSISLGRMAKACEAMDHLESYPYKETLTNELKTISALILIKFKELDLDITELLKKRWSEIEARSIFKVSPITNKEPGSNSIRKP